MAVVYLVKTPDVDRRPYSHRDYERVLQYAGLDTIRKHECTEDAEKASIVAFIGEGGANFAGVLSSSLYKRYKRKSVVVHAADRCIPLLPGVYTCLEKDLAQYNSAAVAGFYLRVTDDQELDIEQSLNGARYLYSFVGNMTSHPVRQEIGKVRDKRALIADRYDDKTSSEMERDQAREKANYVKTLAESKFVLCPRGNGVSSWRLFETMRAARVPVIISDPWVPMRGPAWERFSVRIRESQVGDLPLILTTMEPKAEQMATMARTEWEKWFGKDVVFNTLVDLLILADANRNREGAGTRALLYSKYLRPYFFRAFVLATAKQRLKTGLTRLMQKT